MVYIGLGANLGRPQETLHSAARALAALSGAESFALSPLYRSAPMGPQDQPEYVNAVARLVTELAPLELLDTLQDIEQAHGRVRGPQRWGPRTLDLDLLLYADRVIDHPRLTVPHPGLTERNFVLYPLHDLDPDRVLPDGRRLADLLSRCSSSGLVRIEP